ncbi:uncharacterized protein SPPG_05263 [Spizellomyces punctatus DAOM BR117]|uniref:Uncharacterized protein n=1 Tax=Spizellomyces punctatus (strain DAOM BR117) TaxID=645134 RepID=A0A0L0HEK2_SPIPD|nr:uncharacterized protein SPPG_05263 [Spizellomyces punctatus DAOM BR117]KNC99890.1 hypothetical protein SPPG_05263 [Spizellomyces punctatus DAOM BR117]|eukprot:XP_016607930.1 hypothetical protein SPPG_05263 [Spizellomyces punctatus DAOM BR117]
MFDKPQDKFSTPRALNDRRPTSAPKRLTSQTATTRPLGSVRTTAKPLAEVKTSVRTLTPKTTLRSTTPTPVTTPRPKSQSPSPISTRPAPRKPVAATKNRLSSGSSSDGSNGSSPGSGRSSSLGKLQRAVIAPPVEAPRITPKRTTLTGKTTGNIKVKIPGSKARPDSGIADIDTTNLAPAAEGTLEKCKSCQLRSPILDPVAMEIQANDKALRKIMDLEISNTSLLAVNSSLENTIRQQAQELDELRQEIERLKGLSSVNAETVAILANGSTTKSPAPVEDSRSEPAVVDIDSLIKEDEHVEIAFARICATIQQMVGDGKKAAEYETPAHIIDEAQARDAEATARRDLIRKESRSALGKTLASSQGDTFSSLNSHSQQAANGSMAVTSVPMTVKVGKRSRASRSSMSSGSDVSRSSSSSKSSSSSGACNSIPNKNEPHTEGDKDMKARRLSIVMRPVVDTPTHAYLDDPYVLLENPMPMTTNYYGSNRCQSRPQFGGARMRPDDMDSLLSA